VVTPASASDRAAKLNRAGPASPGVGETALHLLSSVSVGRSGTEFASLGTRSPSPGDLSCASQRTRDVRIRERRCAARGVATAQGLRITTWSAPPLKVNVTDGTFFATVNEHGSPNEVVHGVPSSQVPVTEVEPSFVTVAVQIPLSEVAEPTSVG